MRAVHICADNDGSEDCVCVGTQLRAEKGKRERRRATTDDYHHGSTTDDCESVSGPLPLTLPARTGRQYKRTTSLESYHQT